VPESDASRNSDDRADAQTLLDQLAAIDVADLAGQVTETEAWLRRQCVRALGLHHARGWVSRGFLPRV
jgi:hypothetical protein